jgi:hypothetical protein
MNHSPTKVEARRMAMMERMVVAWLLLFLSIAMVVPHWPLWTPT